MAKDKTQRVEASTQALETQGTKAVALPDYGEHMGDGFQGQTNRDITIPFLKILQSNSPQVESDTPEGSRPGMLYNTVTEELYAGATGILIVPCLTKHSYIEWVPRKKGGGFVAEYEIHDPVVEKALAKLKADNGKLNELMLGDNELKETFTIYGVHVTEDLDVLSPLIISCDSMKIKPYRNWNTSVRMFTIPVPDPENPGKFKKKNPPLYGNLVRVTTEPDETPKGKFHNIKLSPANGSIVSSLLEVEDPRFQAAFETKRLVESGVAKAAYDTAQRADGVEEAAGERKVGKSFF